MRKQPSGKRLPLLSQWRKASNPKTSPEFELPPKRTVWKNNFFDSIGQQQSLAMSWISVSDHVFPYHLVQKMPVKSAEAHATWETLVVIHLTEFLQVLENHGAHRAIG